MRVLIAHRNTSLHGDFCPIATVTEVRADPAMTIHGRFGRQIDELQWWLDFGEVMMAR